MNKDKSCFRCASVLFFGEIISSQSMRPDLRKLMAITYILLLKLKKELQAFLGMLSYFRSFPQ